MSETMTAQSGIAAQRPVPLDKTTVLPVHRSLYIDSAWREPLAGGSLALTNPATGASLGLVAQAGPADVDAAVAAASRAYRVWKQVAPAERAKILRRIAQIVRANARELALIDAIDGGNPVHEMEGDVANAAAQLDFFAGLVTEMKGHSVPLGRDSVNFSVREPRGVIGRIIPFNHPFMFCAAKSAAPLAAGNTVIVKPPDQAPLSSLRFADTFPDHEHAPTILGAAADDLYDMKDFAPALSAGRYNVRYADTEGRIDPLEVGAGGVAKCMLDEAK